MQFKSNVIGLRSALNSVAKGTGLGLAIARQIVVETHRGTIEVDSKLGQVTIFNILIPIEIQEK